MLIKAARVKWVSDQIGYGLFASELIPRGTLIYVKDPIDVVIKENVYNHSPQLKDQIDKYSYEDYESNYIICWDLGKYMNHCCSPNTLSTGYEFEIAVKDIQIGEEITDDYRLFSSTLDFTPTCASTFCPDNQFSKQLIESWDSQIKLALIDFEKVKQPLNFLLDTHTRQNIDAYLKNSNEYVSVDRLFRGKVDWL